MRRLRTSTLALGLGLTLLAAPLAAQNGSGSGAKPKPEPKPAPAIKASHAFVGGVLIDGSGQPPMPQSVILVDKGKIVAIGPASKLKVPKGAEVINCKGKTVVPGMIDGRSLLFVDPRDRPSRDVVNRMADALDLFDKRARSALARGVTAVHVGPTGLRPPVGQLFGGEGVLVKLAPDGERTGRVAIARATVTGTYVVHAGAASTPGRHVPAFDRYRQQLEAAETYKESWDKYDKKLAKYEKDHTAWKKQKAAWDAKKKAFEAAKKKAPVKKAPPKKKAPPAKGKGKAPAKKPAVKKLPPAPKEPTKPREPKRDDKLDVLRAVLAGQQRLILRVDKSADIDSALKLAKEFGIALTLDGAIEAAGKVDAIVRGKHAVLLGPARDADVGDVSGMNAQRGTAASLIGSNVTVGIASSGSHALDSRFMRFYAIRAMSGGVPALHAIRCVTLGAAQALGVDERIGSIAKGKDADLVLLDGPFTRLGSKVAAVYIDGKLAYRKESK